MGTIYAMSTFAVSSGENARISPRGANSPGGGGANIQFCQIFPKTALEIERIWVLGGAGAPHASLDPPLVILTSYRQVGLSRKTSNMNTKFMHQILRYPEKFVSIHMQFPYMQ